MPVASNRRHRPTGRALLADRRERAAELAATEDRMKAIAEDAQGIVPGIKPADLFVLLAVWELLRVGDVTAQSDEERAGAGGCGSFAGISPRIGAKGPAWRSFACQIAAAEASMRLPRSSQLVQTGRVCMRWRRHQSGKYPWISSIAWAATTSTDAVSGT